LALGALDQVKWVDEFNMVMENRNYEKVKVIFQFSHLGLTCFLQGMQWVLRLARKYSVNDLPGLPFVRKNRLNAIL
jgi:hypothetical protein